MNKLNRQLALLFVASDVSRKLRSTLELGAVVAIVMLLTTLAAWNYQTYVIRAQLSEAFFLTSTVKTEMIVYRAQTGQWPDTGSDLHDYTLKEKTSLGRFVDHIDLHLGGSYSTIFDTDRPAPILNGGRLTFRPVFIPSHPGTPVFWRCSGYSAPGGTAAGSDESGIEALHLPSACREY